MTGCFEFEIETVIASVVWKPKQSSFQLNLIAQNIGAGFFACDDTSEACADFITKQITEGDLFDLGEQGCENVSESFERRGVILDLRTLCTFKANSELATALGVHVEKEGRPGKEKAHLVLEVMPDGMWIELPRSAKRRVLKTRNDGGVLVEKVSWSLKPSSRTASHRFEVDKTITPIFETYPTLVEHLTKRALLKP